MKLKLLTVVATTTSIVSSPVLAECSIGEGRTVHPMEPAALVEKFYANITYRAIEQLGYEIAEPAEAEYATIHMAVAAGDVDFTGAHWNVLHTTLFEEAGGSAVMSRVGTPVKDGIQGYVVDKKSYDSGVTSLEDFRDPAVAAQFDSDGDGKADLIGCEPGWGCELTIEHHLSELELRDTVTHSQGAYDAMMADTISRYNNGQPVFYFTWIPYWVSGVMAPGREVEWLDVPRISGDEALATDLDGKNLGFGIDYSSYLANNKFLDDNPGIRKLFESISIDVSYGSAEALRNNSGEDSIEDVKRHADEWIADHQAEFDGWVNAACQNE